MGKQLHLGASISTSVKWGSYWDSSPRALHTRYVQRQNKPSLRVNHYYKDYYLGMLYVQAMIAALKALTALNRNFLLILQDTKA